MPRYLDLSARPRRCAAVVAMMLVTLWSLSALCAEDAPISLEQVRARIRYASMQGSATFRASASVSLRSGQERIVLDSGVYTIAAVDVRKAAQRYHVFPKTFAPSERVEMEAYLREWRERGQTPTVETFGLLFQAGDGRRLDNRRHWISLARFDSERAAQAFIDQLKGESVWAWMRSETVAPGSAMFKVTDANNVARATFPAPLEIDSDSPIELFDVSSGFWKERKANPQLQPPLNVVIGPESNMYFFGLLPVETYLRGVVPAEMPASWPAEALKAQAVVARSEIYASLAGKYRLEGFDFTALESCRAYWGLGGHQPATDAAVQATAGQALAHNGMFVQTVFSSCCGGWTEHNENVWSGPANPMLRGAPDAAPGVSMPSPGRELHRFLSTSPRAWCAGDASGFRWQRRYSAKEVTDMVNRHHKVGAVRRIEEGPRGVSGRLKSVTIVGATATVTVERELAIRRVFGGLPSAMVIIRATPESGAPQSFSFLGGGRGHGVGLCQHGARGMAGSGLKHDAILAHYFPGASLERTR